MRCPACGADNSDDSRFCEDCGGTLAPRCPSCGAPLGAGRPFCGQCGSPSGLVAATTSEAAGARAPDPQPEHREERRLATVLFCDLAGFTSMSERMDVEEVKAMASSCAEMMAREVQRFGGTVTAIMGDAIMGVFGAPVAHEDDPERAVRAAISIRQLISSVRGAPVPLEVHAGVNTGEIMAGLMGPTERADYTAMGDTTNTAARLMSAAPSGQILVGEDTYLATRHVVTYGDATPIAAKGKSALVRAWEVLDVAALAAPRPLGAAPFVGRRAELEALATLFEDVVRERRVRAALVVGTAGIGKTRLLRESIGSLRGVTQVHWGRCLAYGEGITYWPLVELIRSAAGILHDDGVEVASARLATLLGSLPSASADETRAMAVALSNLLGVPVADLSTGDASSITQGELHWGIRQVLEGLASQGPAILVLEDLHWAEPTLLEFLDSLVRSESDVPVMLLATARPEVLDAVALPPDAGHLVLRLEGLGDKECRAILVDLMGQAVGTAERGETLLRNAQGNPLFLEETVRMLASRGSGAEPTLDDLADVPIPTSVQGLIGARLDLLPSDEGRLAQHGSVVGQMLWPGAVTFVGNWERDVAPGLDDLVGREVLEVHRESSVEGEREYAFRHILIRDVAYRRLPKGERSVLHDRCAEWFTRFAGERDELIELVAYHLEQACALAPRFGQAAQDRPVRRAVEALAAAAEKAEHREGIREAHRFYVRALEVLGDELPELAAEYRLGRARMAAALGDLSQADDELCTVVEEARTLSLQGVLGRALVALANVHLKQGRASDAGARLDEARAIALDTGDRWLQVRASYETSALRGDFEGDVDGAIEELRGAMGVAVELGELALQVEGLMREGNLQVNVGRLGDAERTMRSCGELAGRLGSRRDDARATFLLGLILFYRSGAAPAEHLGLRAHELLTRIGDGYFLPQSLRALAKYAMNDGRPALAERRLREALALVEDGGGWLVVELNRYLTEALVDQGRVDDAATAAAHARDAVPEEDAYARAAALLAAAMVAAAGPRPDAAWPAFAESVALMEDQQLWIDAAEARILHAEALARHARPGDADEQLVAARALFEPMEADAMLATIDARLAELRGATTPSSASDAVG